MVDTLREILKQEKQSLRYSASDLGALTGYHPYVDIVTLVDKYLYQDLALLRDIDAKTLGVGFVSVEEEVESIVSKKLTTKQQALLQNVQQALTVKHQLNSQAQAKKLIENIDYIIKKELQNNVDLTKEDKILLEQELKGRVRKQYGTNCEDDALNRYEDMMGFSVVERNAQLYILEVPLLQTSFHELSVLSRTTSSSSSSSSSSATLSNTLSDLSAVDLSEDIQEIITPKNITGPSCSTMLQKTMTLKKRSQEAGSAEANEKKKQSKHEPAFSIVGRVDGISYQIDMSSEDCTQWGEAKVVVEMKNRVRRISQPPPLYEQIQLVAYMIMTDSLHGDLVQSMAVAPPPSVPTTIVSSSTIEVATSGKEMKSEGAADRRSDPHHTHTTSDKTERARQSRSKDKGILAYLASIPSESQTETIIDLSLDSDTEASDEEQAVKDRKGMSSSCSEAATADDGPPLVVPSIVISPLGAIADTTESTAIKDPEGEVSTAECSNAAVDSSSSTAGETAGQGEQKSDSSTETFLISRVSLEGPPYQHRHHWDQVIIPRLHLFRQAIMTMRHDDSLRYQFLLASEEEKLGIINSLCPYYQF